jgi:hypothetical protein
MSCHFITMTQSKMSSTHHPLNLINALKQGACSVIKLQEGFPAFWLMYKDQNSHVPHNNTAINCSAHIQWWSQKILPPDDGVAVLVCVITFGDVHTMMKSPKHAFLRAHSRRLSDRSSMILCRHSLLCHGECSDKRTECLHSFAKKL